MAFTSASPCLFLRVAGLTRAKQQLILVAAGGAVDPLAKAVRCKESDVRLTSLQVSSVPSCHLAGRDVRGCRGLTAPLRAAIGLCPAQPLYC